MLFLFILFLIFMAVRFAVRYLSRRPDLLARGLMWMMTRRQRREQKEREKETRRARNTYRGSRNTANRSAWTHGQEEIIPREYAQDVEYEEVAVTDRVVQPVHTHVENQVSDAEWEEIS